MAKIYVNYDELMSVMYHEAFENDDSYNEEILWQNGIQVYGLDINYLKI